MDPSSIPSGLFLLWDLFDMLMEGFGRWDVLKPGG